MVDNPMTLSHNSVTDSGSPDNATMIEFTSRQRDIITAAISLIAEKGIQEVTIKNIAARVGFSEPAVYRHFSNKMAILLAILDFFQGNISQMISEVISTGHTALERLEKVFLHHLQEFENRPAVAAVIFSEEIFRHDRQLSDKVAAIMETVKGELEKVVAWGQARGEIRSDVTPAHLAMVILASLRLTVTRWRLTRQAFDLRDEGGDLWLVLKQLIQTDSPSTKP